MPPKISDNVDCSGTKWGEVVKMTHTFLFEWGILERLFYTDFYHVCR